MPRIPTDITGRLWKPFSVFDIHQSISRQVGLWAVDIGLAKIPEGDLGYIPPIEFAPFLKHALIERLKAVAVLQGKASRKEQAECLIRDVQAVDTQDNPRQSLNNLEALFMEMLRLGLVGFESGDSRAQSLEAFCRADMRDRNLM